MHYFYATNTPLVTIITTGVLVEALGFEPKTSRVKVYCATVTLRLIMEPDVRIERTTYCLQGSCSTTELIRHGSSSRFRPYIVHVNSVSSLLFDYTGILVDTWGIEPLRQIPCKGIPLPTAMTHGGY